ncbi:uncharacterized protein N7506_011465 [Penicillium brevicompactum]|uniref:uncharacterized protein n=1 Tax=Penicillium brevicompactum TaxID=5074 RepID=UPI002541B8DF|nr:uncharacterized protein N7506_011465 [Penicillium brevicompactum]KAJ5318761.1 hypothetical protein N7506_011465 [Penicillium brevicompactum]
MVKFFPLPNDEQIEDFENIILRQSHHFQNRDLIREALQLAGPLNPNGNRVLAQVGDAIIRLILVDQGRNKNKTPGQIQELITRLASNNNLNDRANALGLDPYLVKNSSSQQGLPAGRVVMATSIEAILGAVYYDSNRNWIVCEKVMAIFGLSWPE